MNDFKFLCKYCGWQWKASIFVKSALDNISCPQCKDRNVKMLGNSERTDVFGYRFSEPFPDKKQKEDKVEIEKDSDRKESNGIADYFNYTGGSYFTYYD